MSPFQLEFESLPNVLPIFPLPQAIVLPGSQLPLNIFEERYLNMIFDALGADRLIGMVQPVSADGGGKGIFGIGCAGRISSFSETPDGRLLIVLTGICRFDIVRELPPTGGYRRVEADWGRFSGDYDAAELQGFDHGTLEKHLRPYCQNRGLEVDWKAVHSMELESSVDFFSMNLPFEVSEKQALLEADDIESRAKLLTGFADMALAGSGSGARH